MKNTILELDKKINDAEYLIATQKDIIKYAKLNKIATTVEKLIEITNNSFNTSLKLEEVKTVSEDYYNLIISGGNKSYTLYGLDSASSIDSLNAIAAYMVQATFSLNSLISVGLRPHSLIFLLRHKSRDLRRTHKKLGIPIEKHRLLYRTPVEAFSWYHLTLQKILGM